MVALKCLATGSRDDLFREFGFDQKKVSFEAEHYLGKQKKKGEETGKAGRLDKPALVQENPFANDLDALSVEGANDFFD